MSSVTPTSSRHPTLYFSDGTLTLKANDGTLYNVNRQLLVLKSEFFAGMLTLPPPEAPPGPTEQAVILDGTTDATAVLFPATWTSAESEAFLEFVFNILPWTNEPPPLDRLCAILKTCDFFGVESGFRYATHFLEEHEDLGPALRYQLAKKYNIPSWAKMAFEKLMSESILDLSEEDERWLGWDAYRALVQTKEDVTRHRLELAFFPPQVTHCSQCYSLTFCGDAWAEKWVSISGPLGALLRDEIPAKEFRDTLQQMTVPSMTTECFSLTVRSILAPPAPERNQLKMEEEYILKAVEALIKQW
ncbi:hypothetical protein K438DRAFT_1962421 [Mycena galopus ATCC 62051]|nr:hypothetical protein K438DRAFT_1962421 [Mycena galopus ATCC 62051]